MTILRGRGKQYQKNKHIPEMMNVTTELETIMGQWLYAGLYHEMYMGFFSLSKEAGKGRASEGSARRRER